MTITVALVGETYEAHVERDTYITGNPSLYLIDAFDGMMLTVVSVNLPYNIPDEGCIWVKDWSENEGIVEQLVAAGVIELTGKVASSGTAPKEARLLIGEVQEDES